MGRVIAIVRLQQGARGVLESILETVTALRGFEESSMAAQSCGCRRVSQGCYRKRGEMGCGRGL